MELKFAYCVLIDGYTALEQADFESSKFHDTLPTSWFYDLSSSAPQRLPPAHISMGIDEQGLPVDPPPYSEHKGCGLLLESGSSVRRRSFPRSATVGATQEGSRDQHKLASVQKNQSESISLHTKGANANVKLSFGFGTAHLYCFQDQISESQVNSASSLAAILAVPSYMKTEQFLEFINFAQDKKLSVVHIVRIAERSHYLALFRFLDDTARDAFVVRFNGLQFSSTEPESCHAVHIINIYIKPDCQYEGASLDSNPFFDDKEDSTEQALILSTMKMSLKQPQYKELPTCPACLERMDDHITGLSMLMCQHTPDCSCLSKWGFNFCPVCRFSTETTNSKDGQPYACCLCGQNRNLWICMVCGFVGCSRYENAHVFGHYQETSHSYVLESQTGRIWDYDGDMYVHRLLPAKMEIEKTKEKLELEEDELLMCGPETLDSISAEYMVLLSDQLESQRFYYEEKIDMAHEKLELAISRADMAENKLKQFQDNLNVQSTRLKDLQRKNEEIERLNVSMSQKLMKATERMVVFQKETKEDKILIDALSEKVSYLTDEISKRDRKIEDLEEQLKDMMFAMGMMEREDIKGGTIVTNPLSKSNDRELKGGGKKGRHC